MIKLYSYTLKLPYKVQSSTYCVRLRVSVYSSGIRWMHSFTKSDNEKRNLLKNIHATSISKIMNKRMISTSIISYNAKNNNKIVKRKDLDKNIQILGKTADFAYLLIHKFNIIENASEYPNMISLVFPEKRDIKNLTIIEFEIFDAFLDDILNENTKNLKHDPTNGLMLYSFFVCNYRNEEWLTKEDILTLKYRAVKFVNYCNLFCCYLENDLNYDLYPPVIKTQNVIINNKMNLNEILIDIINKPRNYILEIIPQDKKVILFIKDLDILINNYLKRFIEQRIGMKGIYLMEKKIYEICDSIGNKKIKYSFIQIFLNFKQELKNFLNVPKIKESIKCIKGLQRDIYNDYLKYLQEDIIFWKKQLLKPSKEALLEQIPDKNFAFCLEYVYDNLNKQNINLISILLNKRQKDFCHLNDMEIVAYINFFKEYLPFKNFEDINFIISVDPTKGLFVYYYYQYHNKRLKTEVLHKHLIKFVIDFKTYLQKSNIFLNEKIVTKEEYNLLKEFIVKIEANLKSFTSRQMLQVNDNLDSDIINVLLNFEKIEKLQQDDLIIKNNFLNEDVDTFLKKYLTDQYLFEGRFISKYLNLLDLSNKNKNRIAYKNHPLILHCKNTKRLPSLENEFLIEFLSNESNRKFYKYITKFNEKSSLGKRQFVSTVLANYNLWDLTMLTDDDFDLYIAFFNELFFRYSEEVFEDFIDKLFLDDTGGFGLLNYYINNKPYNFRLNAEDYLKLKKFILKFQYDYPVFIYHDILKNDKELQEYAKVLETEPYNYFNKDKYKFQP